MNRPHSPPFNQALNKLKYEMTLLLLLPLVAFSYFIFSVFVFCVCRETKMNIGTVFFVCLFVGCFLLFVFCSFYAKLSHFCIKVLFLFGFFHRAKKREPNKLIQWFMLTSTACTSKKCIGEYIYCCQVWLHIWFIFHIIYLFCFFTGNCGWLESKTEQRNQQQYYSPFITTFLQQASC